ncbi:uncharacterized protein BJ212DRAFT_1306765 [Suillus subaureus]|uniref:Uncharacterized protein n=1 Tax=Suillus subaureus TaxID=48587 RepID=A0A9P7AR10_9AGAM|nr:uncharacterized protein BJ212DRAFT_1306765 [Suillus subaureus]KAG1794746.1 hypothetical protein BJ212DRAFT_1306765 [Suillus subaureus]
MQPHLKDRLVELQLCLEALPTEIPIPKESKYNFSNFGPDADWTTATQSWMSLTPRIYLKMAQKKADSFDGEAFDAASIINLDSTTLADVLADKDLAPAAPKNTVTLLLASTLVQEKALTEADWDMT